MKYHTFETEGLYSIRSYDFYMTISMEYNHDGYLDITWIDCQCESGDWKPNAKRKMASPRFIRNFLNENWDQLYDECLKNSDNMAELARDQRVDWELESRMMAR